MKTKSYLRDLHERGSTEIVCVILASEFTDTLNINVIKCIKDHNMAVTFHVIKTT